MREANKSINLPGHNAYGQSYEKSRPNEVNGRILFLN